MNVRSALPPSRSLRWSPTFATIAAELCDRGLAERSRDHADRRRYVLRLSPAGERLLTRTEGAIAAAEDELLAPLDRDRRDELYALLRRLADGVDLCPAPSQIAGASDEPDC